MLIFANGPGAALIAGALIASVAAGLTLNAMGLDSDAMFVAVLALSGVGLFGVDYLYLRRRDLSLSPLSRLLSPRPGGHLWFIPSWIQGGLYSFHSPGSAPWSSSRATSSTRCPPGAGSLGSWYSLCHRPTSTWRSSARGGFLP